MRTDTFKTFFLNTHLKNTFTFLSRLRALTHSHKVSAPAVALTLAPPLLALTPSSLVSL